MKVLLKCLFLLTTLSILSYSAIASGATDLVAGDAEARQCCQYQVDCPEDQTCENIYPDCSKELEHICKKKTVAIEPVTP
jgi:hypothetical protein